MGSMMNGGFIVNDCFKERRTRFSKLVQKKRRERLTSQVDIYTHQIKPIGFLQT